MSDGLLLVPSGKYANLAASDLSFSPEGCDAMQITYTATGLKSNVGGQLFFATSTDGTLDEEKKFYMPALTWGGEEQELFIDLKNAQGRAVTWEKWTKATAITKLRLDLVNEYEPGVKVVFKRIRFIDKDTYMKERYKDVVAKGIPMQMDVYLPNAEKKDSADDSIPLYVSKMCAPDSSFSFVGLCNMRIPFTVNGNVKQALWQSVCDDQVEAVWLNGRLIDHKWSIDWATPDAFEIPSDYFVEGENLLAITYRNTGDLGGIMLDLQLLLEDNTYLVVTPEKGTGFTGRASDGWMYPETECAWSNVFTRPGPPAAPWVNFHPGYRTIIPDNGRASVRVISAKSTAVTVAFKSEMPFKEDDSFYAQLYGSNGKMMMNFSGTAEELKATKNEDDELIVTFQAYGGKYYGSATDIKWEFGIVGQNVSGDKEYFVHIDDTPLPGDNVSLKLEQTPFGPTPMLNGKPFFFNILTAHNYADFIFETGMEGHNSPFNVIAVRLGGRGETDWWLGPDTYDFSGVDRTLSLMLERYPDSYLGPYIWCHPGFWYRRTYPERLSRMEDGSEYNYYVAAVTFGHPEVRRDAERAVAALVEHLRKFFGSRVLLVNLMGGISCEWQGWAAHSDQYADFSDFSKQDFKEYAAKAGIENAEIPKRPERESSFDGVLRNPAADAVSILYDRYYSESVAGMVAGIAAAAKAASNGEILVGCYYGYLMEYGNLSHCVNGGGHNDLKTLLESPNMDFFLSPQGSRPPLHLRPPT
ncbi:MAG: hypothetical protein MJ106_05265, partial [Lentisphaeria bacterium]|nr:hypothetical protein [Lentisphaeria bacterium]